MLTSTATFKTTKGTQYEKNIKSMNDKLTLLVLIEYKRMINETTKSIVWEFRIVDQYRIIGSN